MYILAELNQDKLQIQANLIYTEPTKSKNPRGLPGAFITFIFRWENYDSFKNVLLLLHVQVSWVVLPKIVLKFQKGPWFNRPEALFLVVYDPSMNELWATNHRLVNQHGKIKLLVFLVGSHSQKLLLGSKVCEWPIENSFETKNTTKILVHT